MKLSDALNDQYPDNAITVEQLMEKYVKKPWIDGSDEVHLSAIDIMKRLGWKADNAQARRAKTWLKKNGFRNVNDAWCWRVAFLDTPQTPHWVV